MTRRRWIAAALAGCVVVVAAAVVVVRSHGSSGTLATPSVTRAFADRGIAIEVDPALALAPGLPRGQARALLSNRGRTAREGVLSVIVVRANEDARRLSLLHPLVPATTRDSCGGTIADDLRTWRSRNVVVSLSRCNYAAGRLATAPVDADVAAVMHDLR